MNEEPMKGALPSAEQSEAVRDTHTLDAGYGKHALFLVLWLVILHRIYLAASTDFPLNDGGLFYEFVKSISSTFPALPANISYNGLTIPFAYPPLAFWIGAIFTKLGLGPLDVVHVMPLALNAAYFLLFALVLAKSGMRKLTVALVMLCLFANPRSFEWLVMGGGMSRGLGAIFFVLTLLALGLPEATGRHRLKPKRIVLAGLCVGAAILSHLEWGLDAAAIVIILLAMKCPSWTAFCRDLVAAGVVALVAISPWLATILVEHGAAPFLAASDASQRDFLTYSRVAAGAAEAISYNPFMLVGLFYSIKNRKWFWVFAFILFLLVTPRQGLTAVALPMAVFAAQGAIGLANSLAPRISEKTFWACIIPIILFAIWNPDFVATGRTVRPLSDAQQRSMAWVAKHHPRDSFVVLTESRWEADSASEWFPVLTGTRSLNTVQGREWLSDGAFSKWRALDNAIKDSETCGQLLANLAAFDSARFIWVEWGLRCFEESQLRTVHRDGDVTILERAGPRTGFVTPTT